MALYIDMINGYPATVETDLYFNIVMGDMGLGDQLVPGDNTVIQITYIQTIQGMAQTHLHMVVNNFPTKIVITGVDSSFTFSDGSSITSMGGVTFKKPNGVIHIIYDVNECNGSGYHVYDIAGTEIPMPKHVILFHELSHAFHEAGSGNHLQLPTQQKEQIAIDDENGFRYQIKLPLRDHNNHAGGCGYKGTWNWNLESLCYVVSAAYGSREAPEVRSLRQIRDFFLRNSKIGSEIFTLIQKEYYQFSPRIATDMKSNPELRMLILVLAVEPMIKFFTLLKQYALGQQDFEYQVEEAFSKSLELIATIGLTSKQIQWVAQKFTRFANLFGGNLSKTEEQINPEPVEQIEQLIQYLINKVNEGAPFPQHVVFALFIPLAMYWSALSSFAKQEKNLVVEFTNSIENWLASTPIPPIIDQLSGTTLREDLNILKKNIFVKPKVRYSIGTQLLERYENDLLVDIKSILYECDYLPSKINEKGTS
ncbi:CFI-box-CTERM domain-containing protein [Bacillus cereus]|uniref:CFI-box-CTERM domain-containing protein n=1 Tax=Bacillus cereus TaxID=1396 RepID=UPI000DEF9DC2|nr:CFI-box-CTERM domain-containing protein [Bacillus cereus]MDF3554507.1 hypothetical protein [Bacillus cereus]RCL13786.1 hypothetical protein BLO02_024660 [Bacillus cereus]